MSRRLHLLRALPRPCRITLSLRHASLQHIWLETWLAFIAVLLGVLQVKRDQLALLEFVLKSVRARGHRPHGPQVPSLCILACMQA